MNHLEQDEFLYWWDKKSWGSLHSYVFIDKIPCGSQVEFVLTLRWISVENRDICVWIVTILFIVT